MFNYQTEQSSKLSAWNRFWGKSRLERVVVQTLFFGGIIAMAGYVALEILVFNK